MEASVALARWRPSIFISSMEDEHLIREFDVLETCFFIHSSSHAIVALQFPDELLISAAKVSRLIRHHLGADYACKLFVLGDSAYNPLGTDEVAAKHINGSCIIHYGWASLVTPSSLPAFFVFPKSPVFFPPLSSEASRLDLIQSRAESLSRQLIEEIAASFTEDVGLLIVLDQALEHARCILVSAIQDAASKHKLLSKRSVLFTSPAERHLSPGSRKETSTNNRDDENEALVKVWLGPLESPALQMAQLKERDRSRWLCCDLEAQGGSVRLLVKRGTAEATHAMLKRRYYLVEKSKQANIVGILVGTLACNGFRETISLIHRLARQAGKKTYTITVGKPNPAKLANFPELDVLVMVADPLGFLFDSKPFLAPIVSPQEAALAFTGRSLDLEAPYSLDFRDLLQEAQRHNDWVQEEGEAEVDTTLARMGEDLGIGSCSLVARNKNEVVAHNAADYLALKRGYKGLETPITGASILEPSVVVVGRTGRAAGYQEEGCSRP